VGCGISIGALILPFLLAGAWSDFWDSAVVYTLSYVGDTSVLTRLAVFIATGIFPYAVAGPWIVLSVLATIHTLRTPTDSRNWLLIGWLAASGASIIFVGRLFSHYYVQLLPGMSLLVPVGLVALWRRMVSRPKVAIAYGLVIATLVSLVCILSAQVYLRESASNRHEAKFPRDPETQLEVQSPDLGRYIRERTDPSDYVYNLGFQSELYFYSDRRSPTRYMFDRLFEVDKTLMAKALTDLNQNKPKLVIDSARYETWREIRYDRTPIDDFLRINYEYLGKAYYADIYRLRPSSQ